VTAVTSAESIKWSVLNGVDQGGAVALRHDRSIDGGNSGAALSNILPSIRLDRIAKRLADIATATLGLVLFSPLLLMASVAIKLDSPGPVVVRESRYGYKNRPIRILRFRLGKACAESDRTNSRVTRVGRILSQTGIDELPRLVNVLRGEMSIVGPPASTHPKASLSKSKPGMIRWAQIVGSRMSIRAS
jgi:polysaccharide biosynthesis protein PslA